MSIRFSSVSSDSFSLHPQLENDGIAIGDLPVCRVLLMNDSRFPWLVLVPRREGLRDLFDLQDYDYRTVMNEVRRMAQALGALLSAHKMNIAALGNMVPQLHIHIIARFENDDAWPQPVWCSGGGLQPYPLAARADMVNKIKEIVADITKM